MSRIDLKGCGTALITPFKNGEVDYDAFRRLVKRQVEAGVDYLLPLGTTGETPALSREERIRLLEAAREMADGRPVIVGGGTNNLEDTVASMKSLEPYGPDAFLIVVPYYNKPTQEGQYRYFKAVAESTDKPIILYNVPGRTGANMLPQTCVRLACDVKNIIAVKEASGKYEQISEIIRTAPEGFDVISGDDSMTLALMATGASGVISVASNIAPKDVSDMVHFALKGDFESARRLHHKLSELFEACFVESNPIPAKAALELLGLCSGEVRLPLSEADRKTRELFRRILGL